MKTRLFVLGLFVSLTLSISAREFEKGERIYFNATPASATWWKDGTYENTTKLWGRLVDGGSEYWLEVKWQDATTGYLEIPDDANAIRNWKKLVLYRCKASDRNTVFNQTGEIDVDASYALDKNYIENFYYGTYKEEANWENFTFSPSGSPVGASKVDNVSKETIEACISSVGDPLSLQPVLAGDPLTYDYNHSASHAWFKWDGSAWVALDGQKTGKYSGSNAWGYEGGTELKETIGAANSHTFYFLWAEKPSRRRFVEVAVTKDCAATCQITDFGAVTSNVNAHDSTFVLDGIVAFESANGHTLRISVTDAKGEHHVDYVDPTTPLIFSLGGLFADGSTGVTAKAEFIGTTYSATTKFDAPNAVTGVTTHNFTIAPKETKKLEPATDGSGGYTWHDPSITEHEPTVGPCNFDTTIIYTYYEFEDPPSVSGNLIDNGDFSTTDASYYGTINWSNTITGSAISEYNFWGKDVTDASDFYDIHKDGSSSLYGGFSIVTDANKFWKRYTKKIPAKANTHFALFDADNSGTKKAWVVTTAKSPKLTLAKGTNYMFSFWVANINNYGEMNNAAKLQFAIRYKQGGAWSEEKLLGKPIDLNNYLDNIWHQNSYVFTSPVDASEVEILVRDLNASENPGGNDFALDDIQFQPISVVSQAIKNCERFVVKIYEPPTVVDKPVINITKTPACGMTDFAMDVTVSYSTLNDKFPITLELSDDIYGTILTTPLDPAVTPTSITLSLPTSTYAMLVADGKVHTLTAKITRLDGHGVDKGGQNSNTYTSPGVPAIHEPVLTVQSTACDKTTFDLQVATEYLAFKGTKLQYEWDGKQWAKADLPSLSYKEATWQTATGTLHDLRADGKTHTLRVYSDNEALDCEYTLSPVTAPYGPQITTTSATVQAYACDDATFSVTVKAEFINGQGHNIVFEDWNANKQVIATAATDTEKEYTFSYAWETPATHEYKIYFEGAESCANNHKPSFTSPAEPKIDNVAYAIAPVTACNVTTYDLTVTFDYVNQDGTLSVDVDGTPASSITPAFVANSTVKQSATATFTALPADGVARSITVKTTGGLHNCSATKALTGVPHLPVINSVAQAYAPAYACGDAQYHVTLTVNYTNALGKDIKVKEGSTVLKSITANTGAGTFSDDIQLDFNFGTNHNLKVYFEDREDCAQDVAVTSPAAPALTVTPSFIHSCDVTTYSLRLDIAYTNQRGNNILANVDGGTDVTKANAHISQMTEATDFIQIDGLVADGKAHQYNLRFDDAADCSALNVNFTAPYGPQISATSATVQPYACSDATFSVTVKAEFINGQGHNIVFEDWNANKQVIATAATDTEKEYTFSYAWETPATHEYKIYFEGAESCANNHKPSFTSPAEPKIDNVAYAIAPVTACNVTTYDLTVTFDYVNQDGTLSVDVDGTPASSITPAFVANSTVKQSATATFTALPADGVARSITVKTTGGLHNCSATKALTGVPHLPVINSVAQAYAPAYACGDAQYHVTLTVNYTNALGKDIKVKEGSTVLKSITANTGAGTFSDDIQLDFNFGTNHNLKVYFEDREDCAQDVAVTSPAAPALTVTPSFIHSCDVTTYSLRLDIAYTNQRGNNILANVDGGTDVTKANAHISQMTEATDFIQIDGLVADGKAHQYNLRFDDAADCSALNVNFTAPYGPQISATSATVQPYACSDATFSVTVKAEFTNGQGHNLVFEDWNANKQVIATAAADTEKEYTFSYAWETPATHEYKIYFEGAEGCNNHTPSFTSPFAPIIDDVTVTGVPTIVACNVEDYTIAVNFSSLYTPIPAGKQVVITYDSLCEVKTTAPLELTDFPYNLTIYNVANGVHTIGVAFADATDCKKEVSYISPARESCARDSATICEGDSYSWHGQTYTGAVGEHKFVDVTDTLFLFVKEYPTISVGTIAMTCDDAAVVRIPFKAVKGQPDNFDVDIDGSHFAGSLDIAGTDTAFIFTPTTMKAGDYAAKVTVGETGVPCNTTVNINFTIALSGYVYSKWTDVLFVNNKAGLFTSYQWMADGVAMTGETLQRLYDPKGLSGSTIVYQCRLTTTDGRTLYTCPQAFDDVTPSRTVDTTPGKVKATTLYDTMGRSIKSTPHNGIYIVVEEMEDGSIQTRKIAVYE